MPKATALVHLGVESGLGSSLQGVLHFGHTPRMLQGLSDNLTVVNDQVHSTGARFRHKETTATMAGIVPVLIFLDKAIIYTFLDLVLNLVDLVLWGAVWTLSYHRPFEL